ncbi:GNAT family N-acetyltransferase [Aeromonas salmonicida]|uniref:GNAT family N-acetyltransferase n=1 Tax=Aeromonas salmonicida TaxID=645 RepID=UPI003CFBCC2D
MRLIEESDAEFVLNLRSDPRYNNFLSKVESSLDGQKKWIRNYKNDEFYKRQFYFIIERNDGVPCGTVRIYDVRDDSFCWGSWILNEDKTRYAAIESALLVYEFGFNNFKYSKSHFDVMKGNQKVINFHKKFGAMQIGEDDQNYYFEISKESVDLFKEKFKILYV